MDKMLTDARNFSYGKDLRAKTNFFKSPPQPSGAAHQVGFAAGLP